MACLGCLNNISHYCFFKEASVLDTTDQKIIALMVYARQEKDMPLVLMCEIALQADVTNPAVTHAYAYVTAVIANRTESKREPFSK